MHVPSVRYSPKIISILFVIAVVAIVATFEALTSSPNASAQRVPAAAGAGADGSATASPASR